jgi:hypothetical protein
MSVPSAADGVDAALLDACETIRSLLAQAVRDEVLARYHVGSLLVVIKRAPQTYGEHAIERLAGELAMAPPTLYRYATVAESWTLLEIQAQSTRVGRFGEPLSWSHLVTLTKVANASTRRVLVDECLAKGWPVRKLNQAIGALGGAPREDDDTAQAEASVRVALTEGIQNATRAAVELDIFAEALASRLAELEEQDPNAGSHEALVMRAIEAFQGLHVRAESTLSQLRGAKRSSEKRLRCAAPARLDASSEEEDDGDPAAGDAHLRIRVRRR